MLNFKKLFSLLLLLSLSAGANASTFFHPGSLGVLGPATVSAPDLLYVNESFAPGSVDDVFFFTVDTGGLLSAAGASATSIVFEIAGFSIFNIDNFQFALTDATGTLLTNLAGSGDSVTLNPIADGSYGILFKGTATGGSGGSVSGPIVISAVPVPAAAWLFGSAMLGLVGVSRSRKATV